MFSLLFRNHKIHLLSVLGLFSCNDTEIPLTFHILQLVKSLPFHTPET